MSEEQTPRKRGFFGNIWDRWIKNNLTLKIISILFAILLWSIVIVRDDTTRIKNLNNVQLVISGQTDLQQNKKLTARNLADIRAAYPTVSVRVQASQNELAYVTAEKVEVKLDVSNVDSKGVQFVTLSAVYTGTGKVAEIMPNKIEVDVDEYMTKLVPIRVDKVNELPENIWLRNEGNVSVKTDSGTQNLRVSGPKTELDNVAMVVAEYDQSTVKPGQNEAILQYRFVDGHGQAVDSSNLTTNTGQGITAIVNAFSQKTVPVDISNAIKGDPDEDYAITNVEASPNMVKIAGPADQLEDVKSILVEPISVEGWEGTDQATVKLIPPSSDWPSMIPDQITLIVTMEKHTTISTFTDVPVEAIHTPSGKSATIKPVTIVVEGRRSHVERLTKDDIQVTLDCSKYEPGTYQTGDVTVELPEGIDAKATLMPDKTEVRID